MKENVNLVDMIQQHPRESGLFFIFILCFAWQSPAAMIGLILFLILIHGIQVSRWIVSGVGCAFALMAIAFQGNASTLIQQGFTINGKFWLLMLHNQPLTAFVYYYQKGFNFLLGLPLFMAGLLSHIDMIPSYSHREKLMALQRGKKALAQEISERQLTKVLKQLPEFHPSGAVMGVSLTTGKPLIIPERNLNQMTLVLGTTGTGKTITLRQFYRYAAQQNYPLIILDGKPTEENVAWLMELAKRYHRPFYGFNCGNQYHYNPFAQGGHTELKDKIMCLKDAWGNDYYFSIAEDYLQTVFEVLLRSSKACELITVADCLNYGTLFNLAREINDVVLLERVACLEHYERKDLTGLQAHLKVLINSELGELLRLTEHTFDIPSAIAENAMVYFALPALRFPHFSKVLGKLIINDIKTAIDRLTLLQPIFTIFDEFSVFAGQQVLNLVNMGRGKGVHAIFGTQGLADLESVESTFESQLLNCINTVICHRLNDHTSTEKVCAWIGTKDDYDVTAQINLQQSNSGMGSVKLNKAFIIHPDDIKQHLKTGEAFYVTKVDNFKVDKIKINYIA